MLPFVRARRVLALPGLTRRMPLGGLRALALAGLALSSAALAPEPDPYLLGPQDKLRIKVYDWRTGTAEEHQWTALTGEFKVGASGMLSLPLLGEIQAGGQTTAALAGTVAQMLQAKIGLAERPNASVEVLEYRPFYVIGAADKPGEYPYRPGLTVLQAFAIAGGMPRTLGTGAVASERDALVSRGDLRVMSTERLALLARQARVDAQLSGASEIAFPDELRERKDDPAVARATREEELLFTTARDSDRAQVESLKQSKDLLGREVASLGTKAQSLAHQLDLAKTELNQVAGLVTKGLAVVPRQLALEQNTSQFESSQLDVQIATLRAQQDMARIDRDIESIDAKRHDIALNESREVRVRLGELTERIDTTQSLVADAEVRAPELARSDASRAAAEPVFRITRTVDGASKTFSAGEGDPVQPGDTVRVERRPSQSVSTSN